MSSTVLRQTAYALTHPALLLLLGWFAVASFWMGCDKEPKQDLLVGTFTMFNRESPYLIAAPHGEFDENTGEIVYDFCEAVRWDCLIAEGFRNERSLINVNRPTEGLRLDEARFTERASLVYAKYLKRIRRLSPRVQFYVEIHGHDNPSLQKTVEISSVGLTDAQAQFIKDVFDEALRESGQSELEVRLDRFEAIHYKATHARNFGVLSFISPAIHVEFPRLARMEHRKQLVDALVQALPAVSAKVFPSVEGKGVAPGRADRHFDSASSRPLPPLVAVNGNVDDPRINYEIAEKIRLAGGEPVRLPVDGPIDLSPYNALVLVGGADIDPERYGESPHSSVNRLSNSRESFDFALADAAMKAKIPVLALCLGAEELWVLHGGTLIQDIPSEIGESVNHRSGYEGHAVTLVKGSRLERAYGKKSLTVHSNHHQGFDPVSLPPGLVITAESPDGLPEAFELKNPKRFLVGVLWHPERSQDGNTLFHILIAAAKSMPRSHGS